MDVSIPFQPGRRSYWLREALAADPGEPCPPLTGSTDVDVAVLGGGFTGMWTAFFLTEYAPGVKIAVIEQDICGGGPSGRNGGFVLGMWDELPVLVRLFGEQGALDVCKAAASSVASIGDWCRTHAVDAWFSGKGWLMAATSPAQDGAWRAATELAARLGVGDRFVELSPQEVQARCTSPAFRGGAFMRDAATVQPARLARGLRRVLLERGVHIHESTPARRFRAGPPAVVETPRGSVRAGQLVLGLNAWAAALPAFRRSLVAWSSYIVLTAPAPDVLERIGWVGGECITDYRTAVRYFRTTPDGRVAMGGGGGGAGGAARVDHMLSGDRWALSLAAEGLPRLLPQFKRIPIEEGWGGPIDVSGTHLPTLGTLAPGNVHYAHGYTGNGVGPSYLSGRILAARALGHEDAATRLPLVDHRPKRFPPEPFRSLGARVIRRAIVRKERLEEVGRPSDPVTSLVAGLPRRLGYNLGPE
jgi:glycine/D-amino acid oxidase-like deaminating enzyme